jgi:putative ABC transport system permease protein
MAVFPAEVLAELFGTLGDARQLVAGLAAGTQLLVLGAGLLTVMVLLATRRQAYAALRALGAPRLYLFGLSWLLAMGVGLRACALAVPLAWGLSVAARGLLRQSTGLALPVAPQWADLALPAGLLLACGLGAALLAGRACSRPVLADLRS